MQRQQAWMLGTCWIEPPDQPQCCKYHSDNDRIEGLYTQHSGLIRWNKGCIDCCTTVRQVEGLDFIYQYTGQIGALYYYHLHGLLVIWTGYCGVRYRVVLLSLVTYSKIEPSSDHLMKSVDMRSVQETVKTQAKCLHIPWVSWYQQKCCIHRCCMSLQIQTCIQSRSTKGLTPKSSNRVNQYWRRLGCAPSPENARRDKMGGLDARPSSSFI